jgi:predicted metalloprotease with PDZ domain
VRIFTAAAAGFLALTSLCAQDAPVRISVDATDAPRRLFHVVMTVPVKAGPMTLLYPEWIPGEHGPTGPIANLVGLKVQAGELAIPWKRDNVNMYAFHIDVPAGVAALDVMFDFISPPEAGGFSSGSSATTQLAVLNWNQFLLYPQGVPPDKLQFQATLRVPNAWRYGTALRIKRESGNQIEFEPASLTTLVDSPVSTGLHYRTIELGAENGISHYLHLAADSDRATEMSPELIAQYKNLVAETGALFGSRHYRNYHFLFTLSDHVAHFGLEHHESSDDRLDERTLIDDGPRRVSASLLPHEFVHSWNGKYRRPAGLATGGFDAPMKGDLLWVYEGLTNYLGEILAPRSGLWSPEDYRESLADTAAMLDTESGRTWRPLEDTAIAAQILYGAGEDYSEYRRSVDYYPEGTLIWLEADVLIRRLSNGAKSLNDFCRAFYGGPGGAPALKTYTFEDVVTGLNSVQSHDWAEFLNTRLRSTGPHAPLGGLENGGWKLVYNGIRSDFWKANEERRKLIDLTYSIGLKVKEDGAIVDVAYGRPAQKAGVAPAAKLIAVNRRQFTPTVLREAVQKSVSSAEPLELLIKVGEFYEVHRIDYHGGEKYPHLERDPATADLLSAIITPVAKR